MVMSLERETLTTEILELVVLTQMNFEREHFEKRGEDYSTGCADHRKRLTEYSRKYVGMVCSKFTEAELAEYIKNYHETEVDELSARFNKVWQLPCIQRMHQEAVDKAAKERSAGNRLHAVATALSQAEGLSEEEREQAKGWALLSRCKIMVGGKEMDPTAVSGMAAGMNQVGGLLMKALSTGGKAREKNVKKLKKMLTNV